MGLYLWTRQVRDLGLAFSKFEVGLGHDLHEFLELHLRLPAELLLGLSGIADEEFHLGRTLVAGIVAHVFLPIEVQQAEGLLDELFDRVRLVGGDHVVVGLVLLEHDPHHLDVFFGVTPVAAGIEVAHVEAVLEAEFDASGGASDLAGDEGLAAARALVVEENAVGGVEVIAFAVVHREPVGVHFRATVRRAGPERRFFRLGHFLDFAKHLGRRGLVEAAFFHEAGFADGFEDAHRAEADDVARVFRNIEGNAHVRLSAEVVNFVGLELVEEFHHLHGIGEIAVVEVEFDAVDVRVAVKVIDPAGVKGGSAANHAVDLVALGEQELSEIRTVLPRDAGDKCFFHAINNHASERAFTGASLHMLT